MLLMVTISDGKHADVGSKIKKLGLPKSKPPLGIDIQANPTSGWGTFCINMVAEMYTKELGFYPVATRKPNSRVDLFDFEFKQIYNEVVGKEEKAFGPGGAQQFFSKGYTKDENPVDFPVVHSIPADCEDGPEKFHMWSSLLNIGVIFLEREYLEPQLVDNLRGFDLILTGCEWNTRTLRYLGLPNVRTILQGVDVKLFAPQSEPEAKPAYLGPNGLYGKGFKQATAADFEGKWVLFSGGKLEIRKGQDLIVAAFRKFLLDHDDVVLVTAWHNQWNFIMKTISGAGNVKGTPVLNEKEGKIDMTTWLEKNGVPAGRAFHLGESEHTTIASLLKRADAAVFANRGEGGTNLVAMEAMASGVPLIISNNTGHVDLIDPSWCFPLVQQQIIHQQEAEGWGEGSVDELVHRMEEAYGDREAAKAKGARAAEFIRSKYTWPKAVADIALAIRSFKRQKNVTLEFGAEGKLGIVWDAKGGVMTRAKKVSPGSQAEAVGVHPGDVLIAVNGKAVPAGVDKSKKEFIGMMQAMVRPGSLTFTRMEAVYSETGGHDEL
jgi:glycosyltransferase involved in cell wall biosynthesis